MQHFLFPSVILCRGWPWEAPFSTVLLSLQWRYCFFWILSMLIWRPEKQNLSVEDHLLLPDGELAGAVSGADVALYMLCICRAKGLLPVLSASSLQPERHVEIQLLAKWTQSVWHCFLAEWNICKRHFPGLFSSSCMHNKCQWNHYRSTKNAQQWAFHTRKVLSPSDLCSSCGLEYPEIFWTLSNNRFVYIDFFDSKILTETFLIFQVTLWITILAVQSRFSQNMFLKSFHWMTNS